MTARSLVVWASRSFLAVMLAWGAVVGRAEERGVDLTQVDRTIGKLPELRSAKPRYCLLVFGPQARIRTWLVIDGRRLYVDRNANGDLTEAGERIELGDDYSEDGFREFAAGDVAPPGSGRKHTGLSVWMLSEESAFVGLTVDGKQERNAYPELTGSPRTAPILHFDGPLEMHVAVPALIRSPKPFDLVVQVGSAGLGTGAFAAVAHEGIPDVAQPAVELEFAPREGNLPIRLDVRLPDRCCGINFDGPIAIPSAAADTSVRLTVRFPDFPGEPVRPTTVTLPIKQSPLR